MTHARGDRTTKRGAADRPRCKGTTRQHWQPQVPPPCPPAAMGCQRRRAKQSSDGELPAREERSLHEHRSRDRRHEKDSLERRLRGLRPARLDGSSRSFCDGGRERRLSTQALPLARLRVHPLVRAARTSDVPPVVAGIAATPTFASRRGS